MRKGLLLRESIASNLLVRAEMKQATNFTYCQIQVDVKDDNNNAEVGPIPVEEDS